MPQPDAPLSSHPSCHPRRLARRLARWGAVALACLLALVAMAASWLAVQAARLPYNSEGRHFDGIAVHHDGAQWMYAGAALLAWAGVAWLVWWARRLGRPRP